MTAHSQILATRTERFLAFFIDSAALIVVSGFVLGVLGGNEALGLPVLFLCAGAYYTWFTGGDSQGTPGKRLTGLYVRKTDRRPLTRRDALERFLAFSIPFLPVLSQMLEQHLAANISFWLAIFWFSPILFTEERVGYHDRLCRTRVMKGKAKA